MDFGRGYPGWFKEQLGFEAEIPVLKKEIEWRTKLAAEFRASKCDPYNAAAMHEAYVQELEKALTTAESIAYSSQNAVDYWNAGRRWWQPKAVLPPPIPVSTINLSAPVFSDSWKVNRVPSVQAPYW